VEGSGGKQQKLPHPSTAGGRMMGEGDWTIGVEDVLQFRRGGEKSKSDEWTQKEREGARRGEKGREGARRGEKE